MKKIIISLLVVFFLFMSYYGYQRYSFNSIIKSTHPAIKNTSLRLNNSLSLEINNTNISFKELFSKIEADIAEIDKHILTIQSVTTTDTKDEMAGIIEYMNASQNILRSQLQVYRKRFSVKVSLDTSNRMMDNLKENPNEFSLKYAKETLMSVNKETEELKGLEKELPERLLDLLKSKDKVTFLPEDILVDQSLLEKVIMKYQ